MSLTIGIYHDSTRHGQVELDTVFVMEPADYVCEPKGVVTDDEVRQIAKVLRRAPDIKFGVTDRYCWLVEAADRRYHRVSKPGVSAVSSEIETPVGQVPD